MKRACAAIAVVLFTSGVALAQSAEQEIRTLVDAMREAQQTGNKAVLERIYADDLKWVNDGGGVDTKAQRIAGLTGGQELKQLALDVQVYGDTATAIQLLQFPNGIQRRLLRVFVKQNGQWKQVRVSATRVTQPAK